MNEPTRLECVCEGEFVWACGSECSCFHHIPLLTIADAEHLAVKVEARRPALDVDALAWAVFYVATAGMGVNPDRPDKPDSDDLHYADALARQYRAILRRGADPGEKADPPASAPGPLDPAAALNHAISESIATTPPRKKRK